MTVTDRHPTLLYVAPLSDDTAALVAVLERRVQRLFWADSLDAALDLAQNHHPDLILVDVATHEAAGMDVCHRLLAWRAATEERYVPLGVVGDAEQGVAVTRLVQAGADDVIWRHAPQDEIGLRINLLLRLAERRDALTHRYREAQAALRQERAARKRWEGLEAVSAAALADRGLAAVVRRIVEAMAGGVRADAAAVLLPDGTSGGLALVGMTGGDHLWTTALGREVLTRLAPRVAAGRRIRQVTLGDVVGDAASHADEWIMLAAPLPLPDGTSGVVALARRGETFFGGYEIRLFEMMAERVAQAISHTLEREQAGRERASQTQAVRELQHRLRNNLQAIAAILTLQLTSRQPSGDALAAALRRIREMASVQDLMFIHSAEGIPVSALVQQVAAHHAALTQPGQQVRVLDAGEALRLTDQRAQVVGLALNEMVTNGLQHGLGELAGDVRILVGETPDGVEFVVEDTGQRLAADFSLGQERLGGLHVAQLLLEREFHQHPTLVAAADCTRAAFVLPWRYVARGDSQPADGSGSGQVSTSEMGENYVNP